MSVKTFQWKPQLRRLVAGRDQENEP